jgi:Tfp pilus assembly PilM family ATPase
MGDDSLKLAQLADNGSGLTLISSGNEDYPDDVKPGSIRWQRWAIEALDRLIANGDFQGREVVAAVPASEVFIDHIKVPKTNANKLDDAILSKIKQNLPFNSEDTLMRYIGTEENNVVVITTEREKIDRHLAIYEKANLGIKSIGVWPMVLINCYVRFFGRRKTDAKTIVMLLDIETSCTNVVICHHKNLLFARSVPIGVKHLETDGMTAKLVLELVACRRHFSSMYRKAQIERLIFLSGRGQSKTDGKIDATIAEKLEMPAQMGNCLTAVEIAHPSALATDRRDCDLLQKQQELNWATAFGLSLS